MTPNKPRAPCHQSSRFKRLMTHAVKAQVHKWWDQADAAPRWLVSPSRASCPSKPYLSLQCWLGPHGLAPKQCPLATAVSKVCGFQIVGRPCRPQNMRTKLSKRRELANTSTECTASGSLATRLQCGNKLLIVICLHTGGLQMGDHLRAIFDGVNRKPSKRPRKQVR